MELFGGALASLPDIDVFAGGNAAAVKTAGGDWEMLQFAEAELIGTNHYRLTRLLRGQAGTEQAMATGAAIGADFVLLDGAVTPLPLRSDQLGLPLSYRIGAARDDYAAPSFSALTVTAEGVGLTPFAPVQLRYRRDAGSGDITLTWIRRTRFGGVGWELAEVPLNEESEAYRLEILDGAEVVRSVDLDAPTYRLRGRRPDRRFRDDRHDVPGAHRAAQRDGRRGAQAGGNGLCLRPVRSKLPLLVAEQAQKHVTHNEALRLLDALVKTRVVEQGLTAPPGSPAEGDIYIPGSGATGDWSAWDFNLATYLDGAWQKIVPQVGWLVYDIDQDAYYKFEGGPTYWVEFVSGGSGDVTGPASATDNGIPRFDGTGGKTLQSSSATLGDDGALEIVSSSQFRPTVTLTNTYDASINTGPYWNSRRSRSGLAVQSGDALGTFNFQGADADNSNQNAGSVACAAAAAPGSGYVPCYFRFVTTNTSGSSGERARISSEGDIQMGGANTVIDANRIHRLRSYTVATLPTPGTAARLAWCSDETGGPVPVYDDGTNWRRVSDGAVAS